MERFIEVSKLPNFEVTCSNGKKYVLLPFEHLYDIPAADVVKVLRCEDCRHSRKQQSKLGLVWCEKWGNIVRPCDFCSYGKLTYKRFIAELGNTGNVSNDDLCAMYEAYLDDRATE